MKNFGISSLSSMQKKTSVHTSEHSYANLLWNVGTYFKNNLRRKIWQKTFDSFLSNLLLFFFLEPLKKAQDDFRKNIFAVLFRHESRKAGKIYRRLPDGDRNDRKPWNNKMELIDYCI